MTVEETSTAQLLNSLVGVLTPFARTLAYGKDKAGDIALQEERNRFNTLNGSGADNPGLATNQSPRGLLDQLFGSPLQRGSGTAAAGSTGWTVGRIAVLGVLAFGAFWVFKRL